MFINYTIDDGTEIASILGINSEIVSLEIEVEYSVSKVFNGTLFDSPEYEEVNVKFMQVLSVKVKRSLNQTINLTKNESCSIIDLIDMKVIKELCLKDYRHQEDEHIKEQASRLIENNY